MVSIGVDPSFTATGIIILNKGELSYEKTTTNLGPKEGPITRTLSIADDVKKSMIQHKPKIAVIEGFSYGSNSKSIFERAYLNWRIREVFESEMCRWIEIAPSTLKKYATGKGTSSKEEVMIGIFDLWGKTFKDDNKADAFVLAQIGQAIINNKTPMEKHQAEMLKEIKRRNVIV